MLESYYDSRPDINRCISAWKQINGGIPLHYHDCIEILYVSSGTVNALVDGLGCRLSEGNIMLASGFTPHSLYGAKNCEYYVITIPRHFLLEWNRLPDYSAFSECFLTDDENHTISSLIILIHDIHEKKNLFANGFFTPSESDLELRMLSISLLNILIKLSPPTPKKQLTVPVADAVRYMNLHYKEKLLVSDIAKALYCNTQKLSEQFRSVMHVGITDYICSLRTAEAARLLADCPEMKLDDVMQRSGFQSMRSMYRAIWEQYGCTPSQMKHPKNSREKS